MAENIKKSDIVIIGGVACGPKTAASLARRIRGASITLYQKEKHLSYGSCGLPYFASGDINSFKELISTSYGIERSPDFFKRSKQFDAVTDAEVIAIDRNKKRITVRMIESGDTFEHNYDKLVLATGAVPKQPRFRVAQSPNISHFTRPGDAIAFRQTAEKGKVGKALIIGAGFIGCELAETTGGLWGIETTLVEKENQLLPYILDPEIAAIARREMEKQDVEVITGATVEKIELDATANPVVHISNHGPITADYVFLCLGVTPESSLARDCGLEIGNTGGIVVNSKMQSSDPSIYAGGDCVESPHQLTGRKICLPMGSLANRHGRVIAENIAGNRSEFPGVLGAFLVKIFDLNIGAVGLSQNAANAAGIETSAVLGAFGDKPDYYPEGKIMTVKMVYDHEGQVLGLQAAGTGDICRRVDTASALLQSKASLDDLLAFEHGYAPPYAEALDPLHHLAAMAQAQRRGIDFICPGDVVNTSEEEIIWLDVRELEEAEAEPWPMNENGTLVNIPLNDLSQQLDTFEKKSKIVVVCKRGPRSYQAAVVLRQAGFDNVQVISGGYQASWL
jgi:NADPH-dependent 2,4-dienoyl-CoA reductase/sulfur reductase-like enzyme/rhodanese-related sulfurtransferase